MTDQSRKNLNENLESSGHTGPNNDQSDHLESEINNLLSDRDNTGFLSGALNVLHSEDRPKPQSPLELPLQKIHFNDNEQALRQ